MGWELQRSLSIVGDIAASEQHELDLERLDDVRSWVRRQEIFRTSWVYAARGKNFAKTMLRLAKERETLSVIADQHGAPTSAELIADVTALALHRAVLTRSDTGLAGTYHLVARGETSWHGYAQYVLTVAREQGCMLKAVPEEVCPIHTEDYPLPAKRPRNSRLNVSKLTNIYGVHLPDWRNHVRRLIEELASQGNL